MRKNKMMRTASGLLVATLLTTCVISGTFAKYTSSASGSDTARVAKWSFKVGETDIVAQDSITFNLFDTIKEADTKTEETNVATATSGNTIIAPGTGGSFDIVLKNESEVTAKYKIDFTETNESTIPIEYSTDGTSWKSSIDELDVNISNEDGTALGFTTSDNTKTITVYWRWSYNAAETPVRNQSDANDTALGKDGNATVTVKAEITATQVD